MSFETRAPLVAEQLVGELDPILQKATSDAGWGNPIELTQDSGSINLEYFEFRTEEIFNLEYGNETRPPAVVIRPFLNKAEVVIQQAVETDAIEYLFAKGILP